MTSRRSFVAALSSLASFAFAPGQPPPPAAPPGAWDLSWLEKFKGKHKQVFDLGSFDLSTDTPLRVPTNYLDTFRDVFHMSPPDVDVAVGISRAAFPMNASDALWEKFRLGELWNIKDPATEKPATRNIFLGAPATPVTVKALQARGALFWQCNAALGAVVLQLANATKRSAPEVRAEVVAGLNPGVIIVPAHAMAIGLVQERGFTYEKV